MLLDVVKRLYEYHAEMTERVLQVAEGLTVEQFTTVVVPGQPSLRDTLVHLCVAQCIHLSWWDGSLSGEESFDRDFPPEDYSDIRAVRKVWEELLSGTRAFLATLTDDADLERVYSRIGLDGGLRRRHLWEMMMHILFHAAQHRSEAALMLTALGHSAGDLDLL